MKTIQSIKFVAGNPIIMKLFGHLVPVYPDEFASLADDMHKISKAREMELKMRKKCAPGFTKASETKQNIYLYFRSLQCLQAQMLEANKRRPVKDRLSLHQIIKASTEYRVLVHLDEPVKIYNIPKSSGYGVRTIQDFGPVARGAQHMVRTILKTHYEPASFQYTSRGVKEAIDDAITLITEEEYTHVAELDIISHYPSFT